VPDESPHPATRESLSWYPAAVSLDDGTVFVVYYIRIANEQPWIMGSVLAIT